MGDLERYKKLIGRKCFCTTIANENIYQKLTSYNQDNLTFESITGGELNVPIRHNLFWDGKDQITRVILDGVGMVTDHGNPDYN